MTATEVIDDLVAHLIELVVEVTILLKVIRQAQPPPGDCLVQTDQTPRPEQDNGG